MGHTIGRGHVKPGWRWTTPCHAAKLTAWRSSCGNLRNRTRIHAFCRTRPPQRRFTPWYPRHKVDPEIARHIFMTVPAAQFDWCVEIMAVHELLQHAAAAVTGESAK